MHYLTGVNSSHPLTQIKSSLENNSVITTPCTSASWNVWMGYLLLTVLHY